MGAVVVSVDYRLAPEYPAPVRDCYGALVWLAEQSKALGFDPARLGAYGGSAGGGLALTAALRVRDLEGPERCFVLAASPMLDDHNETASSRELDNLRPIRDRTKNLEAWSWYLGGQEADPYAASSRAQDLSGLPPIFIDVGELDLFRDEDVASTLPKLHVYPGALHASEHLAPTAGLSPRMVGTRLKSLPRGLYGVEQGAGAPVVPRGCLLKGRRAT
nr:alpha/beta hydrolase fold domain-containing protein [Deinococcus humi]